MEIKLFELFCTDTLRHRETARKIIASIPKDNINPIISFEKIDFASRSFMHELLFGLRNINPIFLNMNQEVKQMFNLIQKRIVCIHC